MKTLIILSAVLSFFFNEKTTQSYTLQEAINNGIITCSFKGNPESTHYLKPLTVKIKNNTKKDISIKIENGLQFEASDSAYQNVILTNDIIVNIPATYSRTKALYGMCTEKTDAAPTSSDLKYNFKGKAKGKLLELTKLIKENKYYSYAGQATVWALACNSPLINILGYNNDASQKLVKFASEATNKPIPEAPKDNDYRYNFESRTINIEFSGKYTYDFQSPIEVSAAMFDTSNIVVRPLVKDTIVQGKSLLTYSFDASVYTDDTYYIRFIANDDIIFNRKIDMTKYRR